jgi:hypothetical protein
MVSKEATLNGVELKPTFVYDIPTKVGQEIILVKK